MSAEARGTFEVQLIPQPFSHEDIPLHRLSITKQFQGDLQGISLGEMLSTMGAVEGSAGYAAIERFEGTLHGRSGSFVLQHFGIVNRGTKRLIVEIVPDTGEGDLLGISGTLQIVVEEGVHSYVLAYILPDR